MAKPLPLGNTFIIHCETSTMWQNLFISSLNLHILAKPLSFMVKLLPLDKTSSFMAKLLSLGKTFLFLG